MIGSSQLHPRPTSGAFDSISTIHDPRSAIHDQLSTIHDPRYTVYDVPPCVTLTDPRAAHQPHRHPSIVLRPLRGWAEQVDPHPRLHGRGRRTRRADEEEASGECAEDIVCEEESQGLAGRAGKCGSGARRLVARVWVRGFGFSPGNGPAWVGIGIVALPMAREEHETISPRRIILVSSTRQSSYRTSLTEHFLLMPLLDLFVPVPVYVPVWYCRCPRLCLRL